MGMRQESRPDLLGDVAGGYAASIVRAVQQVYPNDLHHPMTSPHDRPRPRQIHPAFYGCYDWHSCVEMHWALVRLLRLPPDAPPASDVRTVLHGHLTADALATETAYLDDHPRFERPYGWGWALLLAHELSSWDDPDARRWAANIRPLADTVAELFLAWLARPTYPSRDGAHANSAFGLVRALPLARARTHDGDPSLLAAISQAAHRWYGDDTNHPAGWEPNGGDFLSPALTETELMSEVLQPAAFADWLDRFLPGLANGHPSSLFEPAIVSDPTDGQIVHLHGLHALLVRRAGEQHLAQPGRERHGLTIHAQAGMVEPRVVEHVGDQIVNLLHVGVHRA